MSRRTPPDSSRPRRRQSNARRAALCGVVLVAFAAAGTGFGLGLAGTTKGRADPSARLRPFGVGEVVCTFVDHSRTTENFATGTTSDGRILRTEIRYPTADAKATGSPAPASGRPFPVIVFAHGYGLEPNTYAALLRAWVRAGFVVVAPVFPDTNTVAVRAIGGSDEAEDDIVNQPEDLTFVARQVIADSRHRSATCPRIVGLVRADEIGLAGQSDGGETAAMAAYDDRYDVHAGVVYRAVAVLSGEEESWTVGMADPYVGRRSGPPLLVTQSASDECNPPQYSVKLYDDIDVGAKWFLRIDEATHLGPYTGSDPPAFAVVSQTTTRFFEIEVAHRRGAKLMVVGNAERHVATLATGPTAPLMPVLEQSPAACYAN